jgi:hypothetical protein
MRSRFAGVDLNYYDTLIAVADDCRAVRAEVPMPKGGRPTVAVIQYEMLSKNPGQLTQEDVLFESWLRRQDDPEPAEDVRSALRDQFFSRPQACLRASPLPKKHGWGLLFDGAGRITLCPMESDEYQRIVAGDEPGIRVLKAMRSSRR